MRALLLLVSAQALAPSRRTFLVAAAGGAASASTDSVVQQITLPEAVKAIITDANPDWVRAVVQAGFIYRGVAEAGPTLRRDPYDLYSPATYNSARAATYFRSLDAALDKNKAPGPRARKAHLAVAAQRAETDPTGDLTAVLPKIHADARGWTLADVSGADLKRALAFE